MFIDLVKGLYQRHFNHPQIISLVITLLLAFVIILTLSYTLMPLLVSIVIAYLLNHLVRMMGRLGLGYALSIGLSYGLFLSFIGVCFLVLLPLLSQESLRLLHEFPTMFAQGRTFLQHFVKQHPDWLPLDLLLRSMADLQGGFLRIGHFILTYSLSSLSNVMAWLVYLILVPLLVFFLLKDGHLFLIWLRPYWPKHRQLVDQMLVRMDHRIGRYLYGRIIEMICVGSVMTIVTMWMKLPYALLVSMLVGLSVLIPIIGAVVVSLFVLMIAFLAWGFTIPFMHFIIIYFLIIVLDANVLVPLLFAEAMDLHPIVVIVSVLFFGALWGFWGLFFAIPLASLFKVIIEVWRGALQDDAKTRRV